jgi:hypothetical protein
MKSLFVVFVAHLFFVSAALAAAPTTYQVTGPVLDVTNDVIVVEKDKERWEIARDKDTKITGDLKKGARVTIRYKMSATNVEVKDAAKAKTDAKPQSESKKSATKAK